jgi:pimeloyl-ACP methyl ester carboxylesterase
VPSAFIGGTLDGVIAARLDTIDEAHADLGDYRGSVLVDGAGHWTQQERPAEFNAALLELLARVS